MRKRPTDDDDEVEIAIARRVDATTDVIVNPCTRMPRLRSLGEAATAEVPEPVDWAELHDRVIQGIHAAALALTGSADAEPRGGASVGDVERALAEMDATLQQLQRAHHDLELAQLATEASHRPGSTDPDGRERDWSSHRAAARHQPSAVHLVRTEPIPEWFTHNLDAVLLTGADNTILAANTSACDVLRLSEGQICRRGQQTFTMQDDRRWGRALAERSRIGHVHAVLPMRRGNGDAFSADVSSMTFAATDGSPRAFVMFRDTSIEDGLRNELAHAADELQRLALEDELTGLTNRRGFYRAATQMLANADRDGSTIHAAYLDIRAFKTINDRFGHAAGDTALVAVAELLRSRIRTVDIVARVGGDEFVVVFYRANRGHAEQIMGRIVDQLANAESSSIPIIVDWGLAERPANSSVDLNRLLHEADLAMYQRKGLSPTPYQFP